MTKEGVLFIAPEYVAHNEPGMLRLRRGYPDIVFATRREVAVEEMTALGDDVIAIMIGLQETIDRRVLDALPRLSVIGSIGVGTDHLALDALRERGIRLVTAVGSNSVSVAEHALTLLLVLLKQLPAALSAGGGVQARFAIPRPHQLSGRTVGTVGAGNSATALLRTLRAFGCPLRYWTPNRAKHEADLAGVAEYRGLTELFAECDAVSLHLPLNPQTAVLITPEHIASLPAHGIVVNVARGGLLERPEIAEAFRRREDLRYGVDDPAPLFQGMQGRLVSTPHIAGITVEALLAMQEAVIDGLTEGR